MIIKFEIQLVAKEAINGYKVGETVTIVNPIFNSSIGVAFFEINKNFDIVYARQFIGILDIKDNEIYNKDIIQSFDSEGNEVKHLITFNESEARYEAHHLPIYDFSSKGKVSQSWVNEFSKVVIGNAYLNPELLK